MLELTPDVVLFLGAGASLPAPAGGPLFAEVRDACAERIGVRTADWPADDPRRKLLDHVIPEGRDHPAARRIRRLCADPGHRPGRKSAGAGGDTAGAAEHLRRARAWPRKGAGSAAAILAERAEQRAARGDAASAAQDWSALSRSRLPLWSGIGSMRLAEIGTDPAANAAAAQQAFTAAGSALGALRTRALAERWPQERTASAALGLGPAEVFAPGRLWLM